MSKQTSVKWLFDTLWDEPKDKLTWYSILNKAEEMHKQEIVDAVTYGNNFYRNCESAVVTGEKYYDENFK